MNKFTNKNLKEQTTMGSPSVGAGGHIDIAYGKFDRPGPNPQKDDSIAIVPKEMVATQLATERPPVDDEDYVPSSIAELAIASSEIAKRVPPDQVKEFYLRLKELADESVDRQETTTIGEKDMFESAFRKNLVKMIREAIDELDESASDEMSYEDIGQQLGIKPTQVAGIEKTAIEKLKTGDSKEMDKILQTAKSSFLESLEEIIAAVSEDDPDATPEEMEESSQIAKSLQYIYDKFERKSAANLLYDEPVFEKFYNTAFPLESSVGKQNKLRRSFESVVRERVKSKYKELTGVSVPPGVLSTMVLQCTGQLKGQLKEKKDATIKKKLKSVGQYSPEIFEELIKLRDELFNEVDSEVSSLRTSTTDEELRERMAAHQQMSSEQLKNIVFNSITSEL